MMGHTYAKHSHLLQHKTLCWCWRCFTVVKLLMTGKGDASADPPVISDVTSAEVTLDHAPDRQAHPVVTTRYGRQS